MIILCHTLGGLKKENFETILNCIATGRLNVSTLITERVPLEQYDTIYGDMRRQGSIASILEYPIESNIERIIKVENRQFKILQTEIWNNRSW